MQNISSIVFCFFVLLIRMPASNDFSSGIYILSLRDLVVSRQAESVVQEYYYKFSLILDKVDFLIFKMVKNLS